MKRLPEIQPACNGKTLRSRISVLVPAALTLAAVIAPAGPALADPSPTCRLHAPLPLYTSTTKLVGYINADGGRAYDCIETATLTVRLKKDRPWWPDTVLTTAYATGTDIGAGGLWNCKYVGTMKVYTEVESSLGGKVQSGRILVPCKN